MLPIQVMNGNKRNNPVFLLLLLVLAVLLLNSCASMRGAGGMEKQASGILKGSRPEGTESAFRPGPQFAEELKEKVAAEYWALEGKDRKIPLTLNDQVLAGVDYFLNDARRFMIMALGRSTKFMPMLQAGLKKKGLPVDLAYLVLIESGFRVNAVSPAAAGGLWQFIPATGRRYGLKINDWVDERMHPEKATAAAADYLSDLHDMFGSWPLAAAAYNCGEGKIQQGLQRYNVSDYWELSAQPGFLPEETRRYVPLFLAAVIIAKDPERFGLTDIQYEKPDEYDDVEVPYPTDLDVIAKLVGSDLPTVQRLNPYLKLWCTPLDERNYHIRTPKGTADTFKTKYAQLGPEERRRTSVHTVQTGESLVSIAALYQLSPTTLAQYNGLRSNAVRKGQQIRLPVDANVYMARQKEFQARQVAEQQKLRTSGQKIVYKIKPGDNVFQIAKRYDLQWKDVAAWNNISDVTKLQAGDEITIYLGPLPQTVATGRKEAKPTPAPEKAAPATAPPKTEAPKATPDKEKQVTATAPAPKSDSATKSINYTVQKGDTIWQVAAQHGTKPEQIMAANGLKSPALQPGQVLKINTTGTTSPAPPHPQTTSASAVDKKLETGTAPKKDETKPAASAEKKPEATPTIKKEEAKPTPPGTYTVVATDTVWNIAQRFKVSPEDLQKANGLQSPSLRIGQVLKIPNQSAAPKAPAKTEAAQTEVVAGNTDAAKPATKPEPTKTPPTKAPTTASPSAPGASPQKKGAESAYTVQQGDTLWKIAQRFKVDPEKVRQWNGMKDNNLQPGKVLVIKSDVN